VVQPRYWVEASAVAENLKDKWDRSWLLGWREICRNNDTRTVISTLLPLVAVGHKFPLMLATEGAIKVAGLYANLCSFVLDYAARQKVGSTSLTYFYLKQFPVLPPATYDQRSTWSSDRPLVDWLVPRVLELTYTIWDLEPFARDCGFVTPPFLWSAERRFLLRCELDAAFFHLYGVSRENVEFVMEKFPLVKRKDEQQYGSYRTKNTILEIYDALGAATRTGRPYQTGLNPPPADPSVAHPPRRTGLPQGRSH
jgi:hypothetical protein